MNHEKFSDVQGLLKSKRPDLYKAYILQVGKDKNFLQVNLNTNLDSISYELMYGTSRIVKKLQYSSFNNIIRIWNNDLLDFNRRIK